MKEQILQLEKKFFDINYISNKEYLNNTLHKNYLECGKSGYIYNQEVTINSLLECTTNRNITIYNYTCDQIDSKTYLTHYITIHSDKKYFRTSIWIKEDNLKMLYHQATEYNEEIELIEC